MAMFKHISGHGYGDSFYTKPATRDGQRRTGPALSERLASAAEGSALTALEGALAFVNRRCAALAVLLGGFGVALGLVPLFFGLAWNFGGVATLLALYARHRRRAGDRRISRIQAQAGFVLGVSAIVIGCADVVALLFDL